MIAEQLEFPTKAAAPAVKAEDVRAVLGVLRQNKGWMTAEEIAAALGNASPAFERKVRKVASVAAPSVVSYPGSPGYRFWNFCTVEEIQHCIDAFDSQGRDMIKRGNVYRIAFHRQHREPVETASQLQLVGA